MRAGNDRTYRVIEQVTGPLVWENDSLARGMVREQPVWIEHVHGHHQIDTFRIGVSLEDRPLILAIHRRGAAAAPGSELKTGVGAFDREYEVRGEPAEVVQQVLDLRTLDWVWRHYHGRDPGLGVHGGLLKVSRDLPSAAEEMAGSTPEDTPQVLHDLTTGLQDLARRLVAAYDQAYRHVARAHGDAAASQWARLHESRVRQHQEQGAPATSFARGGAIMFGMLALIAAAFVLWLALQA